MKKKCVVLGRLFLHKKIILDKNISAVVKKSYPPDNDVVKTVQQVLEIHGEIGSNDINILNLWTAGVCFLNILNRNSHIYSDCAHNAKCKLDD